MRVPVQFRLIGEVFALLLGLSGASLVLLLTQSDAEAGAEEHERALPVCGESTGFD